MNNKPEALTRQIQPDEIEWRISNYNEYKALLNVVPYINSRCVMERFDEAFGWQNWSTNIVSTNDGFLCTITTNLDGVVTQKTDGASKTDIEPVKGGISDSLKRAAHQFGLGRDLYNYPKVFVKFPDGTTKDKAKWIPEWAKVQIDTLVKDIIAGKITRETIILSQEGQFTSSNEQHSEPQASSSTTQTYSASTSWKQSTSSDNKGWLNKTTRDGKETDDWKSAVKFLQEGGSIAQLKVKFKISKVNEEELKSLTKQTGGVSAPTVTDDLPF